MKYRIGLLVIFQVSFYFAFAIVKPNSLFTNNGVLQQGVTIPVWGTAAVNEKVTVREALLEVSEKKLGMTAIVNADNQVIGIFTDGDLRRTLAKSRDIHQTVISEVMTNHCSVISADILAAEAMQIMEKKKINALIVVSDQKQAIGALNMHDLIRAGIV